MSTNIVLFCVAFALVSIMIILNLLLLWRLWLVTSQRGVPTEMVERLGQMSAVLSSLQHAQELLRSSLGEAEARLRDSVHQTSARASEQLAQAQKSIGQLQTALANLTDAQRALHQTLQQAQVALSQQLDSNMQTARSELSAGQRALQAALTDAQRTLKGLETVVAELQTQLHRARDALEQIASHQRLEQRDLERLVDMMQRIEAVLLGAPSRGAAGEHILSNVLRHLQEAGMVEVNAPIDVGVLNLHCGYRRDAYCPLTANSQRLN
ncbi:MAG TPA: hypothetical protein EYP10_03445 [Armatimonadetes bacterium]|nr:hypothetical protein [Armatimonadota bacterium]